MAVVSNIRELGEGSRRNLQQAGEGWMGGGRSGEGRAEERETNQKER